MDLGSLGAGFVAGVVIAGILVWIVSARAAERRVAEAERRAQEQVERAIREAADADLAHRETKERLIALQLEKAADERTRPVERPSIKVVPMTDGITSTTRPSYSRPAVNNLKRIRGIGRAVEKRLNRMGITTIKQLAALTAEEARSIEQRLSFPGRIERERWIEQARTLTDQDAAGQGLLEGATPAPAEGAPTTH